MRITVFAFLTLSSTAFAWPWGDPYARGFTGPGPFGGAGFWSMGYPFRGFGGSAWPVYIPPIDMTPMMHWYMGSNVCKDTKHTSNPDEFKEFFKEDNFPGFGGTEQETCRGNNNKYCCLRRLPTNDDYKVEMTKYECCHGFVRNSSGPGCVEIDLRYLMPTLRNMGASELVSLVEKASMADNFHNNNYTIFCPPNSVLEAFQQDLEDELDNEILVKPDHLKIKKKTHLFHLLVSHLSLGFLKIDDLSDNDILATENQQTTIRINVYFTPEKVVTANCVPVSSGDHFARNGIIHVVEKILPTPYKTVADIIAGDSQFSILKGMLSIAGLVQTLRNPNGSYTIFAPTDSAFTSVLSLQNGGSDSRCAASVMKHHIVEHVICSSALLHHARSLNMIGELLSLSRDQHNKLYVDGVQIVVRDLVATNGVVHIIDGLLSTRQTKPVSQVLEESGLNEFLSLIESAKLRSEFDSMENVTFFIPTDEVIEDFRSRHLEFFLSHSESPVDVLRFHVVEGQAELSPTDQVLQSKLENATLRVQVHTTYPQITPQMLVQCATVLSADIKLCGGTLHVVDKLLFPPKNNILEFLESVEGFSTLVLLLRATGLDKRLGDEMKTHTLLAPTDDAFHQLGDEGIFKILEDIERATDLVKMHILLGSVCCTHLKNDLLSGRRQTRTIDGSLLSLDRSLDGVMMAGGAHVVDCDIITTNGVVHMVDAVLSHDIMSFLGGGYLDNVFMLV